MYIFVSYRRADSQHIADRVYERLARAFGAHNMFKDVDNISPGTDFRMVLLEAINRCDILLVVIGDLWLHAVDDTGQRRLDNKDDYVRIEIEAALKRGIPVIPLLVGQTPMPKVESLPPCLKNLAFRAARVVRPDPDFHHDMARLIWALRAYRKLSWHLGLYVSAAVVLVVLGMIFTAGHMSSLGPKEQKRSGLSPEPYTFGEGHVGGRVTARDPQEQLHRTRTAAKEVIEAENEISVFVGHARVFDLKDEKGQPRLITQLQIVDPKVADIEILASDPKQFLLQIFGKSIGSTTLTICFPGQQDNRPKEQARSYLVRVTADSAEPSSALSTDAKTQTLRKTQPTVMRLLDDFVAAGLAEPSRGSRSAAIDDLLNKEVRQAKNEISVIVGHALVLDLKDETGQPNGFPRFSVVNPRVADITLLGDVGDPHLISIIGKGAGTTTLTIWFQWQKNGQLREEGLTYRVRVMAESDRLSRPR